MKNTKKEKRNKNGVVLNQVDLIKNIDSELIDSIETNLDYQENSSHKVNYFSIYKDYILDPVFQDKIEIYGAHYFLFYTYLKVQMLSGEKYYIKNEILNRVIKNYCALYGADREEISNIFNDLVLTKTISLVSTKTLGEIITDPYILYNYRLAMEKRVYNRKTQQNRRAGEEIEEIPSTPLLIEDCEDDLADFN